MQIIWASETHYCDSCESEFSSQLFFYFESKDFIFCQQCLGELYDRIYNPNFTRQDEKRSKPYSKVPIPSSVRWEIWERDNFTCQYCSSRKNLSIDHIVPESMGGRLEHNNLVTACRSCNSKKNKRTPEEANMSLMNDPRCRE